MTGPRIDPTAAPSPARIQQTTVANAEENARLAPIRQPGEGGWTPASFVPLLAAMAVGVLTTVGALISTGVALTLPGLAGAAITGLGVGLGTFFGVKSAGPRKPE